MQQVRLAFAFQTTPVQAQPLSTTFLTFRFIRTVARY